MPRIPTSRLGRSAKLGGLVAGQGARWLGNRAANTVRSDERADEARGEWALRAADELVEQLGQMKGAAMKIGQVLSTVDWDVVPEGEREAFKERLAALRDDVTPVDPKAIRKVVEQDLGGKVSDALRRLRRRARSPRRPSARSTGPRPTTGAMSRSRSSTRASRRPWRPTCAT